MSLFELLLVTGRLPYYEKVCSQGESLRAHGQLASKAISHRLLQLKDKWKKLSDMAEARKKRLEEAVQYQQVKDNNW